MKERGQVSDRIGGWLLYYCLSRAILDPIYFAFTFHELARISRTQLSLSTGFLIAGILAVIFIIRRQEFAFVAVIADCLLRLCFGSFASLHVLRLPYTKSPAAHLIASLIIAILEIGAPIAWLLYFNKSRRVFNRLSRNLWAAR